MACTVEYWHPTTGATLTLNLYAVGSSTVVNTGGDTLTEDGSTRRYTAAVAEALAGVYKARVVNGSGVVLYDGLVKVADDAGTYQIDYVVGQVDTEVAAIQAAIAAVQTEVDKIPRLGETYRHRQMAADEGDKSADVIIEAAV